MHRFALEILVIQAFLVARFPAYPQSRAVLQGRVVDPSGAVMAGVNITVRDRATGSERIVQTDGEGNYQVAALPVGNYRIEVRSPGFQTQVVESFTVEVGLSAVQDFQLRIGDISQEVTVTADSQAVERTTTRDENINNITSMPSAESAGQESPGRRWRSRPEPWVDSAWVRALSGLGSN